MGKLLWYTCVLYVTNTKSCRIYLYYRSARLEVAERCGSFTSPITSGLSTLYCVCCLHLMQETYLCFQASNCQKYSWQLLNVSGDTFTWVQTGRASSCTVVLLPCMCYMQTKSWLFYSVLFILNNVVWISCRQLKEWKLMVVSIPLVLFLTRLPDVQLMVQRCIYFGLMFTIM